MRVINIEDRLSSERGGTTPLNAIEAALNEIEDAEFPPDSAIIILHSITDEEYYQILAGGDVTNESLLWQLEQVRRVILETEE